jgi:uncharacterized Zn-finger protein
MNNVLGAEQTINVSPSQATVCCRGSGNALGHPAVYLTFAGKSTVQCYYCGCKYKQDQLDSGQPQKTD